MSEQASSREFAEPSASASALRGDLRDARQSAPAGGRARGILAAGGTLLARRAIPPKLYRIGELVDYSGMSRQTIHNYTTMGLLTESCWTGGGHRLYDESVFARLDAIAEMRTQRKSLQYIRRHFAGLDDHESPAEGDSPAKD